MSRPVRSDSRLFDLLEGIRLTRLGGRVNDPSTLEVNRTYRVKNIQFYATLQGNFDYHKSSRRSRDMKYEGTRILGVPGLGHLTVYQFRDAYNQLYELFWRWPRALLKQLARRLIINPIPALAGNKGIRLWKNVRPYIEYQNRLHHDMGRAL